MKNNIIKDKYSTNYMAIYEDKKYSINKYGMKRGYFGAIIEKTKITLKLAEKILIIFNDYYKKRVKLEDFFYTENINGYSKNKFEIGFFKGKGESKDSYANNEKIFFRIIDKLLESTVMITKSA